MLICETPPTSVPVSFYWSVGINLKLHKAKQKAITVETHKDEDNPDFGYFFGISR